MKQAKPTEFKKLGLQVSANDKGTEKTKTE